MSIRFNHPSNTVTSTDSLRLVVQGGTTSAPRPIRFDSSSVIMPVKPLPTGEAGAVVFDVVSSTLKYHNGFNWVELLSATDVVAPIQISLADIYNRLNTKIDTVTYGSSTVPSASISGTNLNIVFPTSSGGGGTNIPGLFTSLPPGSITHYSLSSGQSVTSIREQLSGVSGGQNGRDGSAGNPFVTSTGMTFADGNYWAWNGVNGQIVRQVPNLNQAAYLKGITTSGVTKTDSVIASSGSIGGTALTLDQLPPHNFTISGQTSVAGSHQHSIRYRPMGWSGSSPVKDGMGPIQIEAAIYTDAAGDHVHTFFGTSNTIGSGNSHSHALLNVDVSHFNVAILYNIAEPSVALNQSAGDARYVLKTGDTMTGGLNIANSLTLNADDNNLIFFLRNSAGNERAAIYHSNVTNTLRFRSAGGTDVSITNTGLLTAPALVVTGNATVQGKNVVRSVNGQNADANGNVNVSQNTASLNDSGWFKDSSTGMITQWTVGTYVGNEQNQQTVQFPIPFPSRCLSVQVTPQTLASQGSTASDMFFQLMTYDVNGATVLSNGSPFGGQMRPVIFAIGF